MKYIFSLLVILVLASNPLQGQKKSIRLIVRGDDMGFSHSGNQALIKCYKDGIERSVEVLVPSPWFPEAVRLLKENPGVDVGIHLTLTSEWDNIKWRPLTCCPSLQDSSGYFYPMIWADKNYPDNNLLAHHWKLSEIEKVWRAQIGLGLKMIPRITHISGHMGCLTMNDSVNVLAHILAKEYHLEIEQNSPSIKYIDYDGPHTTAKEKIRSFINMLEKLSPDTTYIFVEHPAFNTPEVKAIYLIGYENVAEDRQGVTDMYTDAEVKEVIRKKGIQLISYKDLK